MTLARVALIASVIFGLSMIQARAEDLEAKARRIHAKTLSLDSHIDIPTDLMKGAADPGKPSAMQVDLPKLEHDGQTGGFFIVYVGQTKRDEEGYAKSYAAAIEKFDGIQTMTRVYGARIGLAHSVAEVRALAKAHKKVALIGIENGFVIGKDLARITAFHHLGARYMTLAHVGHNDIADSSIPRLDLGDKTEEHGGLSAYGRDVVAEMNRVGIMVDVSHISRAAMMQATALSKAPVIASHSGVKAVCDHARNLDDEQLLAIAKNGGVVQAVALDVYVKTPAKERLDAMAEASKNFLRSRDSGSYESWRAFEAVKAEVNKAYPQPNVADFVDHIDHIVKVAGIDHAGIASDFGGGGGIQGWQNAGESLNVTRELVKRGYSEADIAKIWGGNVLRVLAANEKVAKELSKK